MRGMSQKISLFIVITMIFTSIGTFSFSEEIISNKGENTNVITDTETVTGSVVEVTVALEQGKSESVESEGSEDIVEYDIENLNRNKYSINEKKIHFDFNLSTPGLNIDEEDIENINLKCLDTGEIIGKMDLLVQYYFSKKEDGTVGISGYFNIEAEPDKTKYYEVEIINNKIKNFIIKKDSEKVTFTDEVSFEKIYSDRNSILDRDMQIVYSELNTKEFGIMMYYVLNLDGDIDKDCELFIEDDLGNKVGKGRINTSQYLDHNNLNGCYFFTDLRFSYDDLSLIVPEKEYKLKFMNKGNVVMEMKTIPTKKFMYESCTVFNGLIENNVLEVILGSPLNIDEANYKLCNDELGKYDLITVVNDLRVFSGKKVILEVSDIPKGEYDLYYSADGKDTKIELLNKVKSNGNALIESNIKDDFVEVGTEASFTKYSFPIICKISKEGLNKDLIDKIINGSSQIILSDSNKSFYPKSKSVKENNGDLYIICEFGDRDIKNGKYNVRISSISNNTVIVRNSKEMDLNLATPIISIESSSESNKMSTNLSKFYIDQNTYPDRITSKLIIRDKDLTKVGEYKKTYGISVEEALYDSNNYLYGYKHKGIEHGFNIENSFNTYKKTFDDYNYTYILDDISADIELSYDKTALRIKRHDLIVGDTSFKIDMEVFKSQTKGDYDIYLATKRNGNEEIVASSVDSYYKEYIDEMLNNTTIVTYNMKFINDVPFENNSDDLYYIKAVKRNNGNEFILPINIYDILCRSISYDPSNRQLSIDIDSRTISKIDSSKPITVRFKIETYDQKGNFIYKYYSNESYIKDNSISVIVPYEIYILNDRNYEFDIVQEDKVICKSKFTTGDTVKVDNWTRFYSAEKIDDDKNSLFCRVIIGSELSKINIDDINKIEVLNFDNLKVGMFDFAKLKSSQYFYGGSKLLVGNMIFDNKIEECVSLKIILKDKRIIQTNNIKMYLDDNKPKLSINNVQNAPFLSRYGQFLISELDRAITINYENCVNISDLNEIKYKIKLESSKSGSVDNELIDAKVISSKIIDDGGGVYDKKISSTVELPQMPNYQDEYQVKCYYKGECVSTFYVNYTEDFYSENVRLLSAGSISNKEDVVYYIMNNVINIDNINKNIKFNFRKKNPLINEHYYYNNYSYTKIGDTESNNYLICLNVDNVPIGTYSTMLVNPINVINVNGEIISTDLPKVNNSANYTYIGNSLKEVKIYGANLSGDSNYKVYVYRLESKRNIYSEFDKTYIPEQATIITNVTVDSNSDISILKNELKELKNGEYVAFFEKDSELVGSCNIVIDEVALSSIIDFEINGGSESTSVRNVSILTKLNGCSSIRYSDDLSALKNMPYQEVNKDELSKGVAIRELSLIGDNGTKTIYMQLKDSKGNESSIIKHNIQLDIPKEKPVDKESNNSDTKDNAENGKETDKESNTNKGNNTESNKDTDVNNNTNNNSGNTSNQDTSSGKTPSGGSTSSGSSNSGSSGGSYSGGGGGFSGGGYVPPSIPATGGTSSEDNSPAEKKLSDISNLAKNITTKTGIKNIEKKIDEVTDIIAKEKDDKNLQKISSQVNKEISVLAKSFKGKKDQNLQKIIEMMGDTSLKAIDSIEDNDKKFEEYKSLANTFLVADKNLKSTDELSRFKSELIRKASMTAGHAKTTVQYGDIIPKYVVDEKKISEVYNSNNKNYKDLETLSNKLLNGSSYINVKKEILVDLIDNKDLKISKVELKKDAIKDIKDKKIDVINIKSENTLLSIDPNTINEKNDYNLVISNRKKSVVKEEEGSKIDYKSLNDKNYLDINLFVGNTKVNNFEKPIILTFNVDEYVDVSALEKKAPMVYCYNDSSKVWEPIGGKYDKTSGTITVVRKDLAKYTVLPVTEDTNEKVNTAQKSVTREDFITLIGKNYGFSSLDSDIMFEDIDRSSESAKFISAAYEIGIVNGKGEKTFEPDGTLTYEEAAVIVARTLSKLDNKKVDKTLTEKLDKIDNNNKISSWAKDEFALVYELGLLDEDAVKNPKANISEKELNELIEKL